jgi:hypothetical protein
MHVELMKNPFGIWKGPKPKPHAPWRGVGVPIMTIFESNEQVQEYLKEVFADGYSESAVCFQKSKSWGSVKRFSQVQTAFND